MILFEFEYFVHQHKDDKFVNDEKSEIIFF